MRFNSDTWALAPFIYLSWKWQKKPPLEIFLRPKYFRGRMNDKTQINLAYGISGIAMIAPVFL